MTIFTTRSVLKAHVQRTTLVKLQERAKEHAGKDSKSHMLQHTHQSGHTTVSIDHFKSVKRGFKSHCY